MKIHVLVNAVPFQFTVPCIYTWCMNTKCKNPILNLFMEISYHRHFRIRKYLTACIETWCFYSQCLQIHFSGHN